MSLQREARLVACVLGTLWGCGAATGVRDDDGADGGGCPEPREDSMAGGYCVGPAACEGVALRMPSGSAGGEGGGAFRALVVVVNCGSDEAPACIEVALLRRTAGGGSEIVGRSWTSVPLPAGLGEEVAIVAPWESWRGFLDDSAGFCMDAVVDPQGLIAQCQGGDDVPNSLPLLGADDCRDSR